jgi:hypothetical protein
MPLGAFVDGKWWFSPLFENGAQWLPAARPVPATWQAHLLGGETRPVHLTRPMDSGEMAVPTDLLLPPGDRFDEFGWAGVAVAGAVSVRLFSEIEEEKHPRDVLRFLDAPASKAALAAIKVHGRTSRKESAKAWAALTDQKIVAEPFRVEHMRSIAERNGSTMYYIEQSIAPMPDCEVHVRATVVKSRAGRLRLTAIEAEPDCDNYLNLQPIAILERGGAACWISAWVLEDGVIFTVTRPGIRTDSDQSNCTMK